MTQRRRFMMAAGFAILSHLSFADTRSSPMAGPAPDRLTPLLRGCGKTASLAAQPELSNDDILDLRKIDNSKTEITVLGVETLSKGGVKQIFHLVMHEVDGKSTEASLCRRCEKANALPTRFRHT